MREGQFTNGQEDPFLFVIPRWKKYLPYVVGVLLVFFPYVVRWFTDIPLLVIFIMLGVGILLYYLLLRLLIRCPHCKKDLRREIYRQGKVFFHCPRCGKAIEIR